jgi:branched-chain amino acid transport system ATP-binding protein
LSGNILEVKDLEVSYGPYKALFGVSFELKEGSSLAVLGSNGAGKSTLGRSLSRLIPIEKGKVLFAKRNICRFSPHQLARMGLIFIPEGRVLFSKMTVEENLKVSLMTFINKKDMPAALERAYSTFPRLGERKSQNAATLSGGEQRMLSLVPALVLEPRLLIVDELSLGLAPITVDDLWRALRLIKQKGTSLIVIEQQVTRALDIAENALILDRGTVKLLGPSDQIKKSLLQTHSQIAGSPEL